MALSSGHRGMDAPAASPADAAHAVAWHDLECGGYRADLALWREVAATDDGDGDGPILDVGAGTGRVALDLAARGHTVVALDREAVLLATLAERAAARGLQELVETVVSDARTFALERRDFALCLVPMQTIQLLSNARERAAFLRRARAHLRPGGHLAIAIVTGLEPFDCAAGDVGPEAETAALDGVLYVSRATRVRVGARRIAIERERRVIAPSSPTPDAPARDVVELARLSVAGLQREGTRAGLVVRDVREIPATDEHVGSVAAMFDA